MLFIAQGVVRKIFDLPLVAAILDDLSVYIAKYPTSASKVGYLAI